MEAGGYVLLIPRPQPPASSKAIESLIKQPFASHLPVYSVQRPVHICSGPSDTQNDSIFDLDYATNDTALRDSRYRPDQETIDREAKVLRSSHVPAGNFPLAVFSLYPYQVERFVVRGTTHLCELVRDIAAEWNTSFASVALMNGDDPIPHPYEIRPCHDLEYVRLSHPHSKESFANVILLVRDICLYNARGPQKRNSDNPDHHQDRLRDRWKDRSSHTIRNFPCEKLNDGQGDQGVGQDEDVGDHECASCPGFDFGW